MPEPEDILRLRQEYAARNERLAGSDIYSYFNPAYLFAIQQRQRMTLSLLRKVGFSSFEDSRVLEIGCGKGGVLLETLTYGIFPKNLHGVDLLQDRVVAANIQLPHLPLLCADARYLPYPDHTFDLVIQFTVFSSVLDQQVKVRIAREMLRVLKPSRGVILWYDFWLNPANPHTRGIRPKEIQQLFPGCKFRFRRVTLAPPLARRLVPLSWVSAEILERLFLFNTHYLGVIQQE